MEDRYEKVNALVNNLNKIRRNIHVAPYEVEIYIDYKEENFFELYIICHTMSQIKNIDYILKNKKRTLSFSLFDSITLDFTSYISLDCQEDIKNLLKNFELFEKEFHIYNLGFNIDIFEYLINIKKLQLNKIEYTHNKGIINETILSKCKNLQTLYMKFANFQTINFHPNFLSKNEKLFSFTLSCDFKESNSLLFLKNIFKNLTILRLYESDYDGSINSQQLIDIMKEKIYPSLLELRITNISLEFLPIDVYFPNLITLELYTNKLTYQGIEYFFKRHRNVKSFKEIYLCQNPQLKNFDFYYLPPNIEKFMINMCGISFEKYRKYILEKYTKIKHLELGKDRIENIFPYSIGGIQELTEEEKDDLSLLDLRCLLNDDLNNSHQGNGYYLYNNKRINTCKVFICDACKYKISCVKCDCCNTNTLKYYARNF